MILMDCSPIPLRGRFIILSKDKSSLWLLANFRYERTSFISLLSKNLGPPIISYGRAYFINLSSMLLICAVSLTKIPNVS